MQPPDGDRFYLTGEFRKVDPPARLAYTFVWEDPDPDDVGNLRRLGRQPANAPLSRGCRPSRARAERAHNAAALGAHQLT